MNDKTINRANQNTETLLDFMSRISLYCGILFTIATFLMFFLPPPDVDLLSITKSPILAIVFFIASATTKYIAGRKR